VLEATPEKRLNLPSPEPAAALSSRFETSAKLGRVPVDEIVEAAIAWAGELLGESEIVAAREEFFTQTGKVFHDDTFYDARISYFIEHFLFERPISGAGQTASLTGMIPYPLVLRHAVDLAPLDEHVKVVIASMAQARHSLFEVEKTRESSLLVKDLLIPQKIEIAAKGEESYRVMEKGTVFQSFVFRLPETCHLGSGLILHPRRARPMINRHLKQARKSGSTAEYPLLCKLASLQLRHLRHRHVDAKLIYQPAKT
jgi:hypothetical protein